MRKWQIIGLGAAVAVFGVAVEIPEYVRGGFSLLPVTLVTISWPIAGVITWLQRPDNPTGKLLLITGLLWSFGSLTLIRHPITWTMGSYLGLPYYIPLAYLLLTFPGRRLPSKLSRYIFRSVIGLALVDVVVLTFRDFSFCKVCSELHLLHVGGYEGITESLLWTIWVAAFVLLLFVGFEVRRRWRQTTRSSRVAFGVVVAAGFVAFTTLQVATTVLYALDFTAQEARPLTRLAWGTFAAVPFGFLVGLLRSQARRARIGELVVELGEQPVPDELQDALRRSLGDPSLVAAIWVPEADRYLMPEGSPLTLPEEGSREVATFLDRHGEPLAVIVHDRELLDEPGLVESMKAATRLAVENERLHDEVLEQLADVQTSRARIVRAADEERRRIERNLHDGAQQRLVSLALSINVMRAELGTDADAEARQGLDRLDNQLKEALAELRDLAHGIHPAILREAGLGPALGSIAERSPLPVEVVGETPDQRFPEEVEATAYFVVAEACSNAAKYAEATRALVDVSLDGDQLVVTISDDGVGGATTRPGGGLSGLADRVSALGGRFEVDGSAAPGTTVSAMIPTAPEDKAEDHAHVPVVAHARTQPEPTPARSAQPLLACRGIGFSYEGRQALQQVDVDVYEGESVALLGTNGAGKSTLLRIVAGLLEPQTGTVFFGGQEITFVPAESRARGGISYVPGGDGVFGSLTVLDNLRVFATGSPESADEKIERAFVDFPPLAARANELAGRLSRGQQQMLALAKGSIAEPLLLIIDELSLGLAPAVAEQLYAILDQMKAAGVALLFVEQSSERALRLADRAYFLHAGRLEFSGPPSDLRGRDDIMRAVFLDHLAEEVLRA